MLLKPLEVFNIFYGESTTCSQSKYYWIDVTSLYYLSDLFFLFVEKCQRASTFRLSPPSRRQQWHCRSSPTSNCGASACQATILKHISANSLCKPTFTLGIHGGRHQLCSDLHPIAFLTIMSFPLCIFFFFLPGASGQSQRSCLGPAMQPWTIPL